MHRAVNEGKQRNIIGPCLRLTRRPVHFRHQRDLLTFTYYFIFILSRVRDRVVSNKFQWIYTLMLITVCSIRLYNRIVNDANAWGSSNSQLAVLCVYCPREREESYDEHARECNIYTVRRKILIFYALGGVENITRITSNLLSAVCFAREITCKRFVGKSAKNSREKVAYDLKSAQTRPDDNQSVSRSFLQHRLTASYRDSDVASLN